MSYKNLNPGGVDHPDQKNHAGFCIRLFATLVDISIIFIVVSILIPWLAPYLKDFLPHQLLALDKDFPEVVVYLPTADSPVIFAVLLLAVTFLCYILPTGARMQGTIGKWLVGIYVGDVSGNQISLPAAFFRFLCYAISLAPLGIGFFIIAIDGEKRALHDIICKTRVFKGAPTAENWIGAEDDYIKLYSRKAKAAAGNKKTVGW